VVLTRADRLDEMEVLVEAVPAAADAAARRAAAAELAHHIKGIVGVSAKVTVAEPGGVERSQGKARRVIDKRAPSGRAG
jgi:phenylacetate-CoA ligase